MAGVDNLSPAVPSPRQLRHVRILGLTVTILTAVALIFLLYVSSATFPLGAWRVTLSVVSSGIGTYLAPRAVAIAGFCFVIGSHAPWLVMPTIYAFFALPIVVLSVVMITLISRMGRGGKYRYAILGSLGLAASVGVIAIPEVMS